MLDRKRLWEPVIGSVLCFISLTDGNGVTGDNVTGGDLFGSPLSEIPQYSRRSSNENPNGLFTDKALAYVYEMAQNLTWKEITVITDRADVVEEVTSRGDSGCCTRHELYDVRTAVLQADSLALTAVFRHLNTEIVLICGSLHLLLETVRQMMSLSNASTLTKQVLDTKWLLVIDSHMVRHLNMTSLKINNVLVVTHDIQSAQINLLTLLWTPNGRHLVDVIANDVNRYMTSDRLFPNQQWGLNGREIRVGINIWAPYTFAVDRNGTTEYAGLCIDLLNILASSLNFSYSLVLPPDGEWGDKRHGQWTGLLRLIETEGIDLTVTPLMLTQERAKAADWTTVPFDYVYTAIVTTKTQESGLALWATFLKPLTWQVYACVAASFLCSLCVVYFTLFRTCDMSPASHDTHILSRDTSSASPKASNRAGSMGGIAEYLFGSLLNRAIPVMWKSRKSCAFISCWSLFGLVLTSSYTCNLTSLFVEVPSRPPFTSLKEMVARDDFRWGTVGGTILLKVLRDSEDPVERVLFDRMIQFVESDPDVLSHDPEVHLQSVLAGSYAFFGESINSEEWIATYCQLVVIPETISGLSSTYNLLTVKHSALTRRLDSLMINLRDTGALAYLRNKWFPKRAGCQQQRSSTNPITTAMLQGPFYVAVVGWTTGTVVLCCECFLRRRRRKDRKPS